MSETNKILRLATAMIFLSLTLLVSGQSIEEARALYNEGGSAVQEGNLEVGVQKFEECVEMCDYLYEEEEDADAEELMMTVQQSLPKMYLQLSQSKAKEKDFNGALEFALKAKESANYISDDDISSKASDLASKIYYANGYQKYKANNLEEAVKELDNSIGEDQTNFKAHLLKIVLLKEMGNEEALIEATKEVMAIQYNDENREKAIATTANYFLVEGATAKQSADYEKAIRQLKTSLEFDNTSSEAYYLLATIYNSQQDYDHAIEAANDGLKLEKSGGDDAARFNYELGTAYFGKGDKENACSAFTKAAVGAYAENANYQIEHVVKCNE
jgi:tetratricopeptide (TPR) repeat protein